MYNNYDYPCGADGPNAPWNQEEIPEREFDVTISSSLSKNTSVDSSNYTIEEDPDGSCIDTSEICWYDEYKKIHLTPLELIERYKNELETKKKFLSNLSEIKKAEWLIKECSDWVEDETEVCY